MLERLKIQRKKTVTPIFTDTSLSSTTKFTFGTQSVSKRLDQQSEGHDISRISLRPQAKLSVSEPGDHYEQEADKIASQVMLMQAPEFAVTSTQQSLQRKCAACEKEEEELQRKSSGSDFQPNNNIESLLGATQGNGSPLSDEVRNFMEPRFGADFSNVRIHTDSTAVQLSRDLGAQAFTYGSDIYYGAGKSPGNNDLTAHELTHVVQQTGNLQMFRIQRETDAGTEAEQMGFFDTGCFRDSFSGSYETKRDLGFNRIGWRLIHSGACTKCEGKTIIDCCEPSDRECENT